MPIIVGSQGSPSTLTAGAFAAGQSKRKLQVQDKALDMITKQQIMGNELANQQTLDQSRDALRYGTDLNDTEFERKFSRTQLVGIQREREALDAAKLSGRFAPDEIATLEKDLDKKMMGLEKTILPRKYPKGKAPGDPYTELKGFVGNYDENGMPANLKQDPGVRPTATYKDRIAAENAAVKAAEQAAARVEMRTNPAPTREEVQKAYDDAYERSFNRSMDTLGGGQQGNTQLPAGVSNVQWGDPSQDRISHQLEMLDRERRGLPANKPENAVQQFLEDAGQLMKKYQSNQINQVPAESALSAEGIDSFISENKIKGVDADILILAHNRWDRETNLIDKALLYDELKDKMRKLGAKKRSK